MEYIPVFVEPEMPRASDEINDHELSLAIHAEVEFEELSGWQILEICRHVAFAFVLLARGYILTI